jgi:hypothetical protein
MSEVINDGMEITYATLDRERKDEEELAATFKELEHLPQFGIILLGIQIGHNVPQKKITGGLK